MVGRTRQSVRPRVDDAVEVEQDKVVLGAQRSAVEPRSAEGPPTSSGPVLGPVLSSVLSCALGFAPGSTAASLGCAGDVQPGTYRRRAAALETFRALHYAATPAGDLADVTLAPPALWDFAALGGLARAQDHHVLRLLSPSLTGGATRESTATEWVRQRSPHRRADARPVPVALVAAGPVRRGGRRRAAAAGNRRMAA